MYNTKEKLRDNVEAIKIAVLYKGQKLSTKELETLSKYSGFGGIKSVLFGDNRTEGWEGASEADYKILPDLENMYEFLRDELTGREYKAVVDSMKSSILFAFYTPPVVVKTFYEVMKQYHHCGKMLDPSGGAGVFVLESRGILPLEQVTVYEKDLLTGKVLKALMPGAMNIPIDIQVKGFEESGTEGDGEFDIVCTNPPYGATPIYDPLIKEKACTTKIHNYFVAKSIEKVKDGGLIGLLISSSFLDTVTNRTSREYLFNKCDFISCICMPDNLFKESGGTEAPSHFLVVRKNSSKTELSTEEQLLCVSENIQWPSGKETTVTISMNKYLQSVTEDVVIGSRKLGKNQYGKPSLEVWWSGEIDQIQFQFAEILTRDFSRRYTSDTQFINRKSDNVSDEKDAPWQQSDDVRKVEAIIRTQEILLQHDYQNDVTTDEELLQKEPVKKLSKRNTEVLKDFQQIKEAFVNLENSQR